MTNLSDDNIKLEKGMNIAQLFYAQLAQVPDQPYREPLFSEEDEEDDDEDDEGSFWTDPFTLFLVGFITVTRCYRSN